MRYQDGFRLLEIARDQDCQFGAFPESSLSFGSFFGVY